MSGGSPERPVIAVSQRIVRAERHGELRDMVSHDLVRWLEGLGFVPAPVSNVLADPAGYLDAVGARALVLSGGNDLMPGAYVDTTSTPTNDAHVERDRTERLLIERSLARKIPVFGICRGAQMINVFFGGRIERLGDRHVRTVHPVRLDPSVAGMAGRDAIEVNSFHQRGIPHDEVAGGLGALAMAPDGTVELLAHRKYPVVGVMWHPERPGTSEEFDARLAGALLRDPAGWLEGIIDRVPAGDGGAP